MKRETENLVLLLIGVSLAMVTITGAYTRYVKPSMLLWLFISAGVLIALAIAAMVRDIRRRGLETAGHDHDADDLPQDQDHSHHNGVVWLLVLPIVLLVFVVPPALSARAAAPAAVSVTNVRPFEELPEQRAPTVALPEVLMRIATGSAGGLDHRLITVTGFTMRDGDTVDLAKIVIVCCAADAQLARLHLGGPAATLAQSFPENTWLRVEGTVPTGQRYTGTEWIPVMDVTSVQRIDPPANTYGS